jgi:hypothetical protein
MSQGVTLKMVRILKAWGNCILERTEDLKGSTKMLRLLHIFPGKYALFCPGLTAKNVKNHGGDYLNDVQAVGQTVY